jgi:hypothetical protein
VTLLTQGIDPPVPLTDEDGTAIDLKGRFGILPSV